MNSDALSSTSSALLVRRPNDLPSEYAVTRHGSQAVTGPGRSLYQLYQSGARRLGNVMDRFAHNLGLGPDAVSIRIQETFGRQQERLLKLDEVFGDNSRNLDLRALEKDCKILMKYALPLQSPMTQLHAFKNIFMLMTRYPGLRQLFLRCKGIREAAPDVWIRVGETYDPKWLFFWRLAARSVWDHDIAPVLEKTLPRELGRICEKHGVIDELLTILSCHKVSDIVACVAIRYLGGILELSTFWVSKSDPRHQSVVEKLFKNVENILRDIGVDSTDLDDSVEDVLFDTEGVDILADAMVGGVEIWINQVPRSQLASQYWFGKFVAFIHLLRWPNAETLVPRSWYHASTEELQSVVPVNRKFEYKLTDVLVEVSESDAEDYRHPSPSHRKTFDVQPLASTTDRGVTGSVSDIDITSDATASNVSTTSLVVSLHEVSSDSRPPPVVDQASILSENHVALENIDNKATPDTEGKDKETSTWPSGGDRHQIVTDVWSDRSQRNERIHEEAERLPRIEQDGGVLQTLSQSHQESAATRGERLKFLEYPKPLDVRALVGSALMSFSLIEPFYAMDRRAEHGVVVNIADKIVHQGDRYLEAISNSVITANNGYKFAQDAIYFCDSITRGQDSVQDLQKFLSSMIALANRAHTLALQTSKDFRSVRIALLEICRDLPDALAKVKVEQNTIMLPTPMSDLETRIAVDPNRLLAPRPFKEVVLSQLEQA